MKTKKFIVQTIPVAILCVFIFTVPWETAIEIPGAGSIAKIVGFAAIGSGVLRIVYRMRLRKLSGTHGLMIAFFCWAALSVYWTIDPAATLSRVQVYCQLFAMVWLIWELSNKRRMFQAQLQSYVFGCFITCFAEVHNLNSGTAYIQDATTVRFSAFGADPNETSLMLAIGIPIAWYFILNRRGILRWMNALYIPLAILAVILTASRDGILCLGISLTIILWTYKSMSKPIKITVACIAGIAVVMLPFFVPDSIWNRLSTIGGSLSGGNLHYRTIIWRSGIEVFKNHPFLGVGAGSYAGSIQYVYRSIVAHNTLLSILVEDGVIGFALFAAILITIISLAWRLKGDERKMYLVMLFTWVIGVSALTWDYRKPTWLIFAFVLSASAIHKQRVSSGEEKATGHGHQSMTHLQWKKRIPG